MVGDADDVSAQRQLDGDQSVPFTWHNWLAVQRVAELGIVPEQVFHRDRLGVF